MFIHGTLALKNIKVLSIYTRSLFLDVAIGAPFGSGPGTVYIYHGSNTRIISSSPQQVCL